ncbi:metal-dependent hydrolase [Wansuia hejianensis]|uniref:Metal-dependent hydrolase n=1 Tax=Wansuia hejianensis TaxID=2763667 RepID=A0A926F104_9FIRM|nr:metal-dependent hydrolase [Wansuia hejianensis]MBC8591381.1 metal-dependent hydrolase [Wansuia hejianensis]
MTGKTHMAIGVLAGLALSTDQPMETKLIIVLASTLGSLIPDIDHPKARLNQKLLLLKNKFYRSLFYLSLAGGFIYLYIIREDILFGLLAIMTFFTGISSHRGFTHSLLGFVIATYIVKIISITYKIPYIYSSFAIGYLSHLIGDFLTPKGIKLFYPLDINISSPITIQIDSNFENIIVALLGIYSLYFLFQSISI